MSTQTQGATGLDGFLLKSTPMAEKPTFVSDLVSPAWPQKISRAPHPSSARALSADSRSGLGVRVTLLALLLSSATDLARDLDRSELLSLALRLASEQSDTELASSIVRSTCWGRALAL